MALDFESKTTRLGVQAKVDTASGDTTILFTDIEGSTVLWEREPERMSLALAQHDAAARAAVERNRGVVVKMIGDGLYAAFADPELAEAIRRAMAVPRSSD